MVRRSKKFFAVLLSVLFFPVAATAFGGEATQDWKAEWDKTVAAARKEGRVAVLHGGGASATMQNMLKDNFQKAYPGIQVDMLVGGGQNVTPRLLAERRAGRYDWDVYIGGTTTALTLLIPAKVLDPIPPALILPEVTDGKKWFGGQIDYADNAETYNLAFGGYVQPPFAYNTKLVKADALQSWWDLLKPEWRGKLIMFDPRAPGTGLASATFIYAQQGLGKDYLRKLLTEQKYDLSLDYRQILEETARGNYLLGWGIHLGIYDELAKKGLPLGRFPVDRIKEGSYLTTATASLGLMNRAPHSNAAKVYINWLLTKDAQAAYSRASTYWSRRVDVPTDHLEQAIVPKAEKYDSYQANYKEKYVAMRDEIVDFLRTVMKR